MAGLEKMITQEKYCMDILTQSLAIQRSIGSLNKLILENHLRTHVTDMLGSGDAKGKAQAVADLLGMYELNNVRGK